MMLEGRHAQQAEDAVAERITRYLAATLHTDIRVRKAAPEGSLPVFITRAYAFYEAEIIDQQCLFMAPKGRPATPADIAKHMAIVQGSHRDIIVFAPDAMSAHNRARLIAHGVPFIVPGNQLYIPALAMDLREHFRNRKDRPHDALSPAAQAVLFHHLLGLDETAKTPSVIAKNLRYSAMTIGRAFDDLAAVGLARTTKKGRERYLRFNEQPRALIDAAKTLLRTPVRTVKYVSDHMLTLPDLKRAGETALAELTDIAAPRMKTYATAAGNWKGVVDTCMLEEVEEDEAAFAIEIWGYDPAGLSDGPQVDPLSLYAQFWNHENERIALAAEQLLEQLPW